MLGQLGNRVQHALRAFTPKDQKAVKTAADTLRANPAFDSVEAIQALGTGEALISFLDTKGSPSVVERAMVIARDHHGAFYHRRTAFGIQEGDQGFAGAQRLNRLDAVKRRIGAQGIGGGFYRFLIFRGEGAQGVLDAVAELAQHPIGNIRRGDSGAGHRRSANLLPGCQRQSVGGGTGHGDRPRLTYGSGHRR